jgi:hypothetical protein
VDYLEKLMMSVVLFVVFLHGVVEACDADSRSSLKLLPRLQTLPQKDVVPLKRANDHFYGLWQSLHSKISVKKLGSDHQI